MIGKTQGIIAPSDQGAHTQLGGLPAASMARGFCIYVQEVKLLRSGREVG